MAYKRPLTTMKMFILFSLILLVSINCLAQKDELGYYSFSEKTDNGLVKFIVTPSSFVSLDKRTGLSEPYVPMSMSYMAKESDGKEV
jgi:hypothetical protein